MTAIVAEVGWLEYVLGSASGVPDIHSIACGGVNLWLDINWR